MNARPSDRSGKEDIHLFCLLDCSGSMRVGGNIQTANRYLRESIPHLRWIAGEGSDFDILVRVLTFSTDAEWYLGNPTPINEFAWKDVPASNGISNMGKALIELAEQIGSLPAGDLIVPPVIIIITDGYPTDEDFQVGPRTLRNQRLGRSAKQFVLPVGQDIDPDELRMLLENPDITVLSSSNPEALSKYIQEFVQEQKQ